MRTPRRSDRFGAFHAFRRVSTEFVTVSGKTLNDKEGWNRLKAGMVVIVTSDPKGVDPVFRAVLAPDALMIVPVATSD